MKERYLEIINIIAEKCGTAEDNDSPANIGERLKAIAGKVLGKGTIYGEAGELMEIPAEKIKSVLDSADENGMLRGPRSSVASDLANRFWLSVLLRRGYDGEYRSRISEILEKSKEATLKMQSVTGEAPFGGPYAEYRTSDLYLSALCGFYAEKAAQIGSIDEAYRFRAAEERALDFLLSELRREGTRGIKNFYDSESVFGMERHVTSRELLAALGVIAGEVSATDESFVLDENSRMEDGASDPYVWKTSEAFHKLIMNSGTYFAEYELAADFGYEANGLGRLQRVGAPGALCLALPFVTAPKYNVNSQNIFEAGISATIETDEGFSLSAEEGSRFELLKTEATEEAVESEFRIRFSDGAVVRESLVLTKKEAVLKLTREKNPMKPEDGNDIAVMLPAFLFDGKDYSEVALHDRDASVTYGGWKLIYETSKSMIDTAITLTNRNGHYRMFMVAGAKSVKVRIRMEKA